MVNPAHTRPPVINTVLGGRGAKLAVMLEEISSCFTPHEVEREGVRARTCTHCWIYYSAALDQCCCQTRTKTTLCLRRYHNQTFSSDLLFYRIYERVIDPPQMEITPGSGVWLGQHSHKHGLFKVRLQKQYPDIHSFPHVRASHS